MEPAPRLLRLRDGREVRIRATCSGDADLLIELHGRLSPHTRYLRFLSPKPGLTRAEAESLAAVDSCTRVALVATAEEAGQERLVGEGHFDAPGGGSAEVALCVRDDYQGIGLGAALCEALADAAQARGLRALTGVVLPSNLAMLRLAARYGAWPAGEGPGEVRLLCPLDDRPSPGPGREAEDAWTVDLILNTEAPARKDSLGC